MTPKNKTAERANGGYMTKKTSAAQIAASARYRAKMTAQSHRLPTGFISDETEAALTELAKTYGSKKDAVVAGVEALAIMTARKKASMAYKKARAELDELLKKSIIKCGENALAVLEKTSETSQLRKALATADKALKEFCS